jgi:hypothetical protein
MSVALLHYKPSSTDLSLAVTINCVFIACVLIHSRVSSLFPIVTFPDDLPGLAKVTVYGFWPPSMYIGMEPHIRTSLGVFIVIVTEEFLAGGKHPVESPGSTVITDPYIAPEPPLESISSTRRGVATPRH